MREEGFIRGEGDLKQTARLDKIKCASMIPGQRGRARGEGYVASAHCLARAAKHAKVQGTFPALMQVSAAFSGFPPSRKCWAAFA
jgi:hypothetical protein